jgi:hypothetical protein
MQSPEKEIDLEAMGMNVTKSAPHRRTTHGELAVCAAHGRAGGARATAAAKSTCAQLEPVS